MVTSVLWLLNRCITSTLVTSCILISLSGARVALAEYKPPADQRPPGDYTSTTGSRGGCAGGGAPLKVLAPQKHVGQTTSTHPTFAWLIPDSISLPMEFTLYEYGSNLSLKVAQRVAMQSSAGIMKFSVPKAQPGLTVGKRYLWQVAILCNPNYPSGDLVAKAEIEVVEVPSALRRALATEAEHLKIAELYAKAGLWYDALGAALNSEVGSGEFTTTLLADLAKLEQPEILQHNAQRE